MFYTIKCEMSCHTVWHVRNMLPYPERMRHGYGYNRTEKEFAHASCDRVWLDSRSTDREERGELFRPHNLRDGDTLVLLSKGDLGYGGEITIFRRALRDRGVTVEVCPKPKETKPAGRPSPFTEMTPDQAEQIRAIWNDPLIYTQAYAVKRATEIMGQPVSRFQLHRVFGKRDQKEQD